MNAFEYLNQVKKLDDRINNKLEEKEQLFTLATRIAAPEGNPNKVQSSHDNDKTANIIVRMVELEKEIDAMVDEYVELKYKIINEIEDIGNETYYNILHKKYIQYKRLSDIAPEMTYSYQRIKELHKAALNVFEKKYYKSIPNHTESYLTDVI